MPKIWLTLLLGYDGKQFCGMQYQNEELRSIQRQLIVTLHKQGFVPSTNYLQLAKVYKWGRAARTDKGVHAILNAISTLFIIDQKFYSEQHQLKRNQLFAKIKSIFEGTDIVIHGIKRVTNRSEMRQMVSSRTYCYLCPLYYFQKIANNNEAIQNNQQFQQILIKINQCCKKFIGTHNFHNYSKDMKAKDPCAKRYILSFEGIEYTTITQQKQTIQQNKPSKKWIKFAIKGQSFIYHQIRKIIGCIIFVMLNNYPPDFINNTFYNNQIPLPLAPPQGLYLSRLWFDSYNKKKQIPQKIQCDENQMESITKFERIMEGRIANSGQKEKQWRQWLSETIKGIDGLNFRNDDEEEIIDNNIDDQ